MPSVEELMDAPGAWYQVAQAQELPTPVLLVFPQRVEHNIRQMLEVAGGPQRLMPHVKTHKCPQVVQMQLDRGIRRFKAATVAEAEMTARLGPQEVMLATQPVGPHIERLFHLARKYPQVQITTLVDCPQVVDQLAQAAQRDELELGVYIDVDPGLGRTGVPPGEAVQELFRRIGAQAGLRFAGLHVYDGHMGKLPPQQRAEAVDATWQKLQPLLDWLDGAAEERYDVVAGGSPSFPHHARHRRATCSPGTTLYWDLGYGTRVPELKLQLAAVLLGRVLSRPADGRVTLDLGIKSLCPDQPRRAEVYGLAGAEMLIHNEEHYVLQPQEPCPWAVGEVVYAVPYHICPTVALYDEVYVVREGQVVGRWPVEARRRSLGV